jgi:hypothetical protein
MIEMCSLVLRTLVIIFHTLMDSVVTAVGFLNKPQPTGGAEEEDGSSLIPQSVDDPRSQAASSDTGEATDQTWAGGCMYVGRAFNGLKAGTVKFDDSKVALHAAGYFALYFVVYSARIVIYPLWTMTPYIPLVCPIYDEGRNWLVSPYFESILCHVVMGMVAMTICAFQLNARLRKRFPVTHRWNGRLYVVAGFACVCALQPLQAVVGQGRFKGPSPYMQGMVLASSLLWITFTAKGVLAARRKQFQEHKQWMLRSVAVLSVPITQVPLCMPPPAHCVSSTSC